MYIHYSYLSNKHRALNKRRGQLEMESKITVEGRKVPNNHRGSKFKIKLLLQNLCPNVSELQYCQN